jgi:hypothetical protein
VAAATDSLNVLSCQTRIFPGRWQSTNADGVHCQSNRIGPWIENCVFEGMADDGVNVYTLPFKLRTYPVDNWIPTGNDYLARLGDLLTLFDPLTGRILDHFHIAETDPAHKRFRLDRPLPKGLQMTTDKLTPSLYNDALACPYTVIRNNIFKDYRGNGLLIKSHWSLIEGNRFEGVSDRPIQVMNNSDVPEGLQGEHLTIFGNQITDCGYDGVYRFAKGAADISVFFSDGNGKLAASRGEQDIFIENNSITQWRRSAIYIGAAQQVTVKDNHITNDPAWIGRADEPEAPIRIESSDKVTVEGNDIKDTRPLKRLIVVNALSKNVVIK